MIDIHKLFAAAKSAGIQMFEARLTSDGKQSVSVFDGELENYTVATDGGLTVRGTVDGKCGVFSSDRVDDEVIPLAISALKESAEYGRALADDMFVAGGAYKYETLDLFDAGLAATPSAEFIEQAKDVALRAKAKDSRIEHVTVEFEFIQSDYRLVNSAGLDLNRKSCYAMLYASAKAVSGADVQSGSHYVILKRLTDFDAGAFVEKLVENAVGLLNGGQIDTGKYTVVYSPECFAVLLKTLLRGFSAFNVNNGMSLIEGKLGKQVFSPLLSVRQAPIGSDVYCRAFDSEGVPCRNMALIDKGVPTGYVYDLETAKLAGVESTGNGALAGGNIRPAVLFTTVDGGNTSPRALFDKIERGVYITDLGGVSTGIDGQSGNYSLQASGYEIKNGVLSPVPLMTVAGNLVTDLRDITAVCDDVTLTYYGVKTPSVAIKNLSVSGVK